MYCVSDCLHISLSLHCAHRDLHVLIHHCPTRRSSALPSKRRERMAVEAKRVKRNHRDLWPRPAIHAEPSLNTPSASSSSATDRGISSHVDKMETLSWPRAGG